jgi:hypothetical protein
MEGMAGEAAGGGRRSSFQGDPARRAGWECENPARRRECPCAWKRDKRDLRQSKKRRNMTELLEESKRDDETQLARHLAF